jgi:membrane-associated phospholipid phosphatase
MQLATQSATPTFTRVAVLNFMMPPMRLIQTERFRKGTVLERVAITTGLINFFVVGYFGVGLSRNSANAHILATTLDNQIPFIACSVWAYLLVLSCALLPLFVVRCSGLFRRTAIAYVLVIAVSLVFFMVFPVSSIQLRVPPTRLDLARFSDWTVSLLYSVDPPYNLFPSLHLSIATLATLSVWKARRSCGVAAFLSVGFAGASVSTLKQHCLIDVVGGLVLGAFVGALILAPYKPSEHPTRAYPWRVTAAYLMLVTVLYCGLYVAYLHYSWMG